jgi:hypothetical protein
MVAEHHSRWVELSAEQWQFLRGVYATNPETPPGMPHGDHAVLARFDDMGSGFVFFIDGDRACTPMRAARAPLAHEGRREPQHQTRRRRLLSRHPEGRLDPSPKPRPAGIATGRKLDAAQPMVAPSGKDDNGMENP